MGNYLNFDNRGFWKAVRSEIYVDKTGLIAFINTRTCWNILSYMIILFARLLIP